MPPSAVVANKTAISDWAFMPGPPRRKRVPGWLQIGGIGWLGSLTEEGWSLGYVYFVRISLLEAVTLKR